MLFKQNALVILKHLFLSTIICTKLLSTGCNVSFVSNNVRYYYVTEQTCPT